MKLSVVVPCYNEGLNVGLFHNEIVKLLEEEKIKYEIIFVNDGSIDDTMEKLKDIARDDKNVKAINFSRNFGKEAAMLAGLEHASGEYVSIIDADLQQQPTVLVDMYKKLIENPEYDVVCAYRDNRDIDSSIKAVFSSIFYGIMNWFTNVKLVPGASDFRVFKKEVCDAIVSMKEKNRFIKGIFSWVGFNTIYVPYTPEIRKFGESKWSMFNLIKYGINGIISFSTLPLYFALLIGLFCFCISILNIIFGLLGTKIIIVLLSIILMCLGIIGMYVARIYNNSLDRPNYIVKEKIGFNKK